MRLGASLRNALSGTWIATVAHVHVGMSAPSVPDLRGRRRYCMDASSFRGETENENARQSNSRRGRGMNEKKDVLRIQPDARMLPQLRCHGCRYYFFAPQGVDWTA